MFFLHLIFITHDYVKKQASNFYARSFLNLESLIKQNNGMLNIQVFWPYLFFKKGKREFFSYFA